MSDLGNYLSLHNTLLGAEDMDSADADAIREGMDAVWRTMSADDQKKARLYGCAPEMYALLKELEWSVANGLGFMCICPACRNGMRDGHKPDCRLAAVLKAVEGAENA